MLRFAKAFFMPFAINNAFLVVVLERVLKA
jgi:hypothetical protein